MGTTVKRRVARAWCEFAMLWQLATHARKKKGQGTSSAQIKIDSEPKLRLPAYPLTRHESISVERLLSRLNGLKLTGTGRWLAKCPAHDDRIPWLSIRPMDDDRIRLHDFADSGVEEVLAAVDLKFPAFPKKLRAGLTNAIIGRSYKSKRYEL